MMKGLERACFTALLTSILGGSFVVACGSDGGGDSEGAAGNAGTAGNTAVGGGAGSGQGTGGSSSSTAAQGMGGRQWGTTSTAPACENGVRTGQECNSATDTACSATVGNNGGMTVTCTCTNDAWACTPTSTGAGGSSSTGTGGSSSTGTSTAATECVQGTNTGSECNPDSDTTCSRLGGMNPRTCSCNTDSSQWQCTAVSTGTGGTTGAGGASSTRTRPTTGGSTGVTTFTIPSFGGMTVSFTLPSIGGAAN
ncbi:MAG: hypothetical protein QM784_00130 [Polyangiaceae bacterium]